MLKSALIFTVILMTFIHPTLKCFQWQPVGCGTYDFSASAGLLLHAMFLILKMIYPTMNSAYWLIPAGTAIIEIILHTVQIYMHTYVRTLQKWMAEVKCCPSFNQAHAVCLQVGNWITKENNSKRETAS